MKWLGEFRCEHPLNVSEHHPSVGIRRVVPGRACVCFGAFVYVRAVVLIKLSDVHRTFDCYLNGTRTISICNYHLSRLSRVPE